MKKKTCSIFAFCLAVMMVIVSACTPDKAPNQKNGRYVEEVYETPTSLYDVNNITQMQDGSIVLSGQSEEGPVFYRSEDNGKNWDKMDTPQAIADKKDNDIYSVYLSKNGEYFAKYYTDTFLPHYLYLDKDGNAKEFDIELPELDEFDYGRYGSNVIDGSIADTDLIAEPDDDGTSDDDTNNGADVDDIDWEHHNSISQIVFGKEGELFGTDDNGNIYQIDLSDGSIKHTYDLDNVWADNISWLDGILVISTWDGLFLYDTETTQPVTEDGLTDVFFTDTNQGYLRSNFDSTSHFWTGSEKDTWYFGNNAGIFRFTRGAGTAEQLLDGRIYTFSKNNSNLYNIIPLENDEYLMLISDWESDEEHPYKLLHYYFSKDAQAAPEHELRVYSLENDYIIQNLVESYQRKHTDILISYEFGYDYDSSITKADALRTLNTEILNGNGPDIIFLDGFPVDNYIDKGLLRDITPIVKEIDEKEGIFQNISSTYEKDGKTYAIPLLFGVPLIFGEKDTISKVSDLKTLADVAESVKELDPEGPGAFGGYSPWNLVCELYGTSAPAWTKDNASLDETVLREYLQQVKRISDMETEINYAELFGWDDYDDSEWDETEYINTDPYLDSTAPITNQTPISIGNLRSFNDFSQITSVMDQYDSLGYDLFSGLSSNVYVPSQVLGIVEGSKYTEESEQFVRYMLSAEGMKSEYYYGFPVNKTAFEESSKPGKYDETKKPDEPNWGTSGFSTKTGKEVSVDLYLYWSSEEQINELMQKIETLNTPYVENTMVERAILVPARDYLKGSMTLDEAVDKIMGELNLYLSEQG